MSECLLVGSLELVIPVMAGGTEPVDLWPSSDEGVGGVFARGIGVEATEDVASRRGKSAEPLGVGIESGGG